MLKFKIKPTLKLADFNIIVFRNLQFHIDPDSYFRRRVDQYNEDEFYFNFDFYHACRNRADQGINVMAFNFTSLTSIILLWSFRHVKH